MVTVLKINTIYTVGTWGVYRSSMYPDVGRTPRLLQSGNWIRYMQGTLDMQFITRCLVDNYCLQSWNFQVIQLASMKNWSLHYFCFKAHVHFYHTECQHNWRELQSSLFRNIHVGVMTDWDGHCCDWSRFLCKCKCACSHSHMQHHEPHLRPAEWIWSPPYLQEQIVSKSTVYSLLILYLLHTQYAIYT